MDFDEEIICQSCGMPLLEEDDFGTNADGSKNNENCSFCFMDGSYVDEGITLQEKIEKNTQLGIEMGIPEADARKISKNTLPKLKRWRGK